MSTGAYARLTYAERAALEVKAQRAIAVVANHDRLRRTKIALQSLMDKLEVAIEQERKFSPAHAEHCFAVGVLHDVVAVAADLEMVEVR